MSNCGVGKTYLCGTFLWWNFFFATGSWVETFVIENRFGGETFLWRIGILVETGAVLKTLVWRIVNCGETLESLIVAKRLCGESLANCGETLVWRIVNCGKTFYCCIGAVS